MNSTSRTNRRGWIGLALVVIAVLAVVVPGVPYAKARNDHGVLLDGTVHALRLPADRTYGLYDDDPDNSGYSMGCTITDGGSQVRTHDAGWNISLSGSENLDQVFNTGSGKLNFTCSANGATLRVRPVPNDLALVSGIVIGAIGGSVGLTLMLLWLWRLPKRRGAATSP